MSRNWVYRLSILALLAVALVGCGSGIASDQADRTLTVVGTGRVRLVPDVAEINVGAEVTSDSVSEAKDEVDERMEDIRAVLDDLGIASEDIQTAQYNIYYESSPGRPEPAGDEPTTPEGVYHVSNTFRVTIRDIERVDDVLDGAVDAGANRVYGVNFTVSDPDQWESSAREDAVADAQARAEELAELSGVTLGPIVRVSEIVGGAGVPRVAAEGLGGGGVAPGEMEFSMQITVEFAIEE